MVEDISKSTVVVLVVLTLAVSMVGTWAVLDQMTHVNYVSEAPPAQGHARINIVNPNVAADTDVANAVASIRIVEAG